MKTGRLWFVLLLTLASAILLLLRRAPKEEVLPLSTGSQGVSSASNVETIRGNPALQAQLQNKGGSNQPTPATLVEDREHKLQEGARKMNTPIKFWGAVVDQDGSPISDVHVTMAVRQWEYSLGQGPRTKHPKRELITRSDGRFQWTDGEGDAVSIESVVKQGYRLSPKTYLGYGAVSGSSENPVVFRMWKVLVAERLVHADKFWGIIPDGRLYTLDLLGQKKSDGRTNGDVVVQISRSKAPGQKIYDWWFMIEGIGGGVIESTNEFMYLAPETGYQDRYIYQAPANSTNWLFTVKKNFFVKSRHGQVFARMAVEVFSDYQDQAVFSVDYYANPAASRVLEYDVSQELRK